MTRSPSTLASGRGGARPAASPIDVAAAVILNSSGEFLLGRRPAGKVYAGYWEFPGGKVEPGEAIKQALRRELEEELGLQVSLAHPWITRTYTYPHGTVRLWFFRVSGWSGTLQDHEHEAIAWQRAENPSVTPMLPANAPVLKSLRLPPVCGVSCAAAMGREAFLARLERSLGGGLRMVQLREPALAPAKLESLGRDVIAHTRRHGALLVVNGDPRVAARLGAEGVHIPSRLLAGLSERPDLEWCGASCHDPLQLEQAERLGLDYVIVGPVRGTPTHPGATVLGWDGFMRLTRGYPLPVLAIGGMLQGDLEDAWQHGAHGVAMIRGAWGQQ